MTPEISSAKEGKQTKETNTKPRNLSFIVVYYAFRRKSTNKKEKIKE
jgi:hypothetical protein